MRARTHARTHAHTHTHIPTHMATVFKYRQPEYGKMLADTHRGERIVFVLFAPGIIFSFSLSLSLSDKKRGIAVGSHIHLWTRHPSPVHWLMTSPSLDWFCTHKRTIIQRIKVCLSVSLPIFCLHPSACFSVHLPVCTIPNGQTTVSS